MSRALLAGHYLAVMLLFGAGCSGPRKSVSELDPGTLDDDGFQAYLAEVELVTVEEAYRAMLILADGEDTTEDFEQRREALESREIAKSAWNLRPNHVIDAGSVAYMVCRICRIGGGVSMRLFGRLGLGDRRYALRELISREMIDGTVDYQYMTGAGLFALLREADAVMEKKGLYESPGIELSDETDRNKQGELIVPETLDTGSKSGS